MVAGPQAAEGFLTQVPGCRGWPSVGPSAGPPACGLHVLTAWTLGHSKRQKRELSGTYTWQSQMSNTDGYRLHVVMWVLWEANSLTSVIPKEGASRVHGL